MNGDGAGGLNGGLGGGINGGLNPDNSFMERTERTETQTYPATSNWDTTISPIIEPFIPQLQVERQLKLKKH